MKLRTFELERFFAQYEFNAPYLLCCSDCESMKISDLLAMEPQTEQQFLHLHLGYTEAPGSPALRAEIASMYVNLEPEDILVHSGAEEAIFNFMHACLNPEDHIIVEFPCYQSLEEVACSIGCEVSRWHLQEDPDGWQADIEQLQKLVRKNTRAIIINSPHNPTGHMLSDTELEQIITLCRTEDIILFADEVYKYLEYPPQSPVPWASERYENAVSLGVMSKSFGLAGLRIGWIATRNHNIHEKMAGFKDYTTICNSAPSEFLALVALRNRQQILQRNREIILNNLSILDEFMQKYSQLFVWNRPQAGPIAFPRITWQKDIDPLVQQMVKEKGVLLLPGRVYHYDEHYFRIGFGRLDFQEGLSRLDEFCQGLR